MTPESALAAAWHLDAEVQPLGDGMIHDTYRVQAPRGNRPPAAGRDFSPASLAPPDATPHFRHGLPGAGEPLVLQRVNQTVFKDVNLLMDNVARVSAHLCAKRPRWAPELVPTAAGGSFSRDGNEVWRLWTWLPGAGALARVETDRQAQVAGRGFGRTYRWLQDLAGPKLEDSIPGFLQLDHYLAEFDRSSGASADLARKVDANRELAARFRARTGYIHGDCRVEHLVLDDAGQPAGVLDLDTVMWGNWAWEFGDLIRSILGERPLASRFEAAARGYLGEAGILATAEELVLAPRYTTFMLAVRFLTDHLQGDRYFKAVRRGENLIRAQAQFRLLEAMESMEPEFLASASRACQPTPLVSSTT